MLDDVNLNEILKSLNFETELDHITYVAAAVYEMRTNGEIPDGGNGLTEPADEAFSGVLGETMMALRDLEDVHKLTITHTGDRYEVRPIKALL